MQELNGICLAYQRAYGFEILNEAKPIITVGIPELEFNYAQLFKMVGVFMRGQPFIDGKLHITVPSTDGRLLMPQYQRLNGSHRIKLYSMSDCCGYPQSEINVGCRFTFATTRDIYNREVSCAQNYECLKTFILETEYLVWMGQATIPFSLWLESKGLVKKVETPITFFHDPVALLPRSGYLGVSVKKESNPKPTYPKPEPPPPPPEKK